MLIHARAAFFGLSIIYFGFFVGKAMACEAGSVQETNKHAISECDGCSGVDWL